MHDATVAGGIGTWPCPRVDELDAISKDVFVALKKFNLGLGTLTYLLNLIGSLGSGGCVLADPLSNPEWGQLNLINHLLANLPHSAHVYTRPWL